MNDGFAIVSESGKSDLGLCRQNRSIRQKRSPATVHNRKSLPNFRVWGHDFPKDLSPTRKDMQAAERSEPHPGKTCASQKGQGPTRQDCAPRKRPSLNPKRRASFRKARLSSKDIFAPKRALHIRGVRYSRKHAIKNYAPFITQTRKWAAADADASIRHILCSISSTLGKSARMTVPKKLDASLRQRPKPNIVPSEPPISASRITPAFDKEGPAALPRRNSRCHGKLPEP